MELAELSSSSVSVVVLGSTASLVAGLATGVGALPVLVLRRISVRAQDVMLGFGAGSVMMLLDVTLG